MIVSYWTGDLYTEVLAGAKTCLVLNKEINKFCF